MMIKYESHTKLDDLIRMEKIQQTSNMKYIYYLEILILEKKLDSHSILIFLALIKQYYLN